jgi:UDP:flavonoid glycosyltransferase YjiC (YdhE family)
VALLLHRHEVESVVLYTTLPVDRVPGMPPITTGRMPPRGPLAKAINRLHWAMLLAKVRWLERRNGMTAAYRRLAARSGFPRARISRGQYGQEPIVRQVVVCADCFEFAADTPSYRRFIGPSIDRERVEPAFEWDRIRADAKLAYCAMGTRTYAETVPFLQRVQQSFASLDGWQVVIAAGDLLPALAASPPCADVVLVRHAPQLALLQRARVMISHGGLGSVKEAIYFGVPLAIFPAADDQFGNAARVAYHRLGEVGTLGGSSPADIAGIVTRVSSSPEVRASLEVMRAKFVAADQRRDIVRIVDEALRRNDIPAPAAIG